ncbi:unnamed protein product [Cladocopium goreaui]|uniref:Fibronectin type-II domain-containing protein n=1 Tax=Cladocopium goreaui TaxID=2562237 RepID=A0A9P1CW27_9DINO|nr:unnamed protein product [Cladocopium goreaui]
MVCNYSLRCLVILLALAASSVAAQQADSLSQEQLKPLTEYRQQHRRLPGFFVFLLCEKQVDGRLCAAAFVQKTHAFTLAALTSQPETLSSHLMSGAPNPQGASGREWCYIEPQAGLCCLANALLPGWCMWQLASGLSEAAWGFCGAHFVDYEALREEAAHAAKAKAQTMREYVAKLGKAQRAAEETLEM